MFLVLLSFAHAVEITVDDQDGSPHFTTTGDDWTTWSTLDFGFDGGDTEYHYTSHTVGGSDRRGTATWHPDIPTAGLWEVQTWYRMTENRTDDADFIVVDGLGERHLRSVDQRGEGASGWVSLAKVWCDEGFDGCPVTLDANDDDQSDEANAVRWVLIDEADPEGEDEEGGVDDCDTFPGLGAHAMVRFASDGDGSGWSSTAAATGPPDDHSASSENVDEGEVLSGFGFLVCDPPGEERIDAVVLAVRARTQYESGPYEVRLRLDGGGSAATVFNGTSQTWHEVVLTDDRDWTWAALAEVVGSVTLHDHPEGNRDSDAWVDTFRLSVRYTSIEGPGGPDDEDTGTGVHTDSGDWDHPPRGDSVAEVDDSSAPDPGGCATAPGGLLAVLAGIFATGRRRQR
jgi:hypothetical protein